MVRYRPSFLQVSANMLPQHEPAKTNAQTDTHLYSHFQPDTLAQMIGGYSCKPLSALVFLPVSCCLSSVFSHSGERQTVRERERERERASGKHYTDSCSRGTDYTGNEQRERERERGVKGGHQTRCIKFNLLHTLLNQEQSMCVCFLSKKGAGN